MLTIEGIKLYSRQELASMLDVNIMTIQKYQKTGRMKSVKIGKGIYTSEESLKEFLNGRIIEKDSQTKENK